MNGNYKQINEDEKIVSLTGLCFYILKKWKIMLVFAVVAAILAGGLFTVKDYKAYKATQGSEQGGSTNTKKVSEYVDASVRAKMETIANYRETIATYEYYYENSIKVKLDPNNIYQGVHEYIFSATDSEEMLKALSICKETLFTDEKYEELIANLSEPTDVSLIKEVVVFTEEYPVVSQYNDFKTTSADCMTLRIDARHYNEEDCKTMHAFVEELMNTLQPMLNAKGVGVEVSLSSAKVERRVDRTTPALGKELRQTITNLYDNIATIESKMTAEEADYYKYLLKENSKVESNVPATQGNASLLDFLNVKMGVLGAIAGVICVAGYYVLLYLAGGFVHNKEELGSWINVPVVELDGETDMLAAFLNGVAANHNVKKIYLTGTSSKINKEVIEKVKAMVAPKGLEVVVGNSILKEGKALQEAMDCGSMILLEKVNISKEKNVKDAIEKAASCGVRVLSIVLEK